MVNAYGPPEVTCASKVDEAWRDDEAGDTAPTARWLPLTNGAVTVADLASPGEPLEFDVVQLRDGTRALDLGDWAGFVGCVFERDERLFFQGFGRSHGQSGPVFEWADLARPGSTRLVAYPHKEMHLWVEVRAERAVEFPREHQGAIEVVVHAMDLEFRAHALAESDWDAKARREASLWFVEGARAHRHRAQRVQCSSFGCDVQNCGQPGVFGCDRQRCDWADAAGATPKVTASAATAKSDFVMGAGWFIWAFVFR